MRKILVKVQHTHTHKVKYCSAPDTCRHRVSNELFTRQIIIHKRVPCRAQRIPSAAIIIFSGAYASVRCAYWLVVQCVSLSNLTM